MRITIEDDSIDLDITEKDMLLKHVIEEIETFLLTVGKVPISLIIDGHSLTQEELETRQENPLTGDEEIEFGVMSLSEFMIENIEGAFEANKELIAKISSFADELYATEKTISPSDVVESLRQFFFFWFRIGKLFPHVFETVPFAGETFSDRIMNMKNFFQEIVDALEENDTVLAADLLQYEVNPIIEIVNETIPLLKEKILELSQPQDINEALSDTAKKAEVKKES
jgi:hypothetical protein